jgi:SAM-dependent methyltransferase
VKAILKRIGRVLLWPLRRFFDPRFAGLEAAIRENVRATLEANELLGRSVADVHASLQEANSRLQNVQAEAEKASGEYFRRLSRGELANLDAPAASVLDRELTSGGFAAQAGLWFNSPVWIGYGEGDVFVRGVNERIAEIPYVFRGLAELPTGSTVLDVGASESTVALSLAFLGYQVTALDPRPYPLTHPRLTSVAASVEDWEHDGTFDAVVCLSTIEHIGIGAYGLAGGSGRTDLAAMRRLLELTKPGGLLLLTTRFGQAGQDDLQRTYDRAGLDELLEGWDVRDRTFLRREDDATWVLAEGVEEPGEELVALVTAVRPA